MTPPTSLTDGERWLPEMQACGSPECANPPHNGYLCRSCAEQLRRDLRAVPWLLQELEITISRQDRIEAADGPSGSETPLPLRLAAVEARDVLHQTLAAWAQHIAGKFEGLPAGQIWTELALTGFLSAHLGAIATDPAAGMCADEIHEARRQAQRAIDRRAEQVYAGPCDDCDQDLYAHPSSAEVECRNPDCLRVYEIEARRSWLLGKLGDQLLTATEASRALAGLLQQPLTASRIRNYGARGRLTQHPPHPSRPRDPLYQVGEIRRLISDLAHEELRGRPAC